MKLTASFRCLVTAAAALVLSAVAPASARQMQGPMVPESFGLSPVARTAIEAAWLTDEERSALRLFHGVWDEQDVRGPADEARLAISRWDLRHPSLDDPAVPVVLRAEARFLRGDLQEAVAMLADDASFKATRLRAEAMETLGDHDAAEASVRDPIAALTKTKIDDAAELSEAVGAMMVRARLQGQPARDFQSMMDLLGRAHQELDRLYWPAVLRQAHLLLDKDNDLEAIGALHETLRLNPRCSDAWYTLGRVALARFDFGSAAVAAEALQRQNPDHPLAALLLAESRLIQDDPDDALDLLAPVIETYPRLRAARAFAAAAQALSYDEAALAAALETCDQLSPGSAQAYFVVGRHLSLNRQYDLSADALEEAVRRQPAWPAPRIELGLMELQSGRETRALAALREVAELDPFNKRAANSLFLIEEMAGYDRIETEHFIIRYRPGIDAAIAKMMPERLERIHEIVSGRFDFEPDRKTVIEVLPDHRRFAVRITGMPFIHTVAACTGPVIAMEVPKEGKKSEHLGLFDWPRVLQHEYTHTITLGQTRNRIPHWLTEAAAVSMEPAPRDYHICVMLAESFREETLFDLDEIKWAFVRPKRQGDRSKAYAQGHWMVEFMNERFGSSALVRLLDRYFRGMREQEAIPDALGVTREAFVASFLEWAGEQVESWGLAAEPSLESLTDELRWADPKLATVMQASQQARLDAVAKRLARQVGEAASPRSKPLRGEDWPDLVRPPVTISDETLAAWLVEHPDHPDLVEVALRRQLGRLERTDESVIPLLEQYAHLRPPDPLPHKKLAEYWLATDTPDRAIRHLEELDIREDKSPVFAVKLAKLYRTRGDVDKGLAKATRALTINPYHAATRELAAALAVEARDFPEARLHIEALTLIEPDRPQHRKRLEAIDRLIDRGS